MATISLRTDDLNGENIPEHTPTTLVFIEDPRGDVSIELDLSDTSFKALQKAVQRFVDKGRPYTPVQRFKAATASSGPSESSLARAWAMAHRPDLNVKERGAVPAAAIAAYREHLASTEQPEGPSTEDERKAAKND